MKLAFKSFSFYSLVISSGILLFTLIFRLVNQSRILAFFPLDSTNDLSSYMAQLFFLDACGFHAHCPYWYGGFTNFLFQAPGWYFFTRPLLALFHDVKIATYLSILLITILGFLCIFFLYKKLTLSPLHRITLFAVFFGNAIAIGNFFRLGRVHELFAWTLFLFFAFFFLKKQEPLHPSFVFTGILYAFIILSNPNVALLASLFYLSLFLVTPSLLERFWIALSALLGILLSSFWWYPFLTHLSGSFILGENLGAHALVFNTLLLPTQIVTSLIMIVFVLLFFLFRKHHKHRSVFYLPFLILSLLVLFRIIAFIPLLNDLLLDYYNILFIFLILILLFQLTPLSKTISHLLYGGLLLATLVSVAFTFLSTPLIPLPTSETSSAYSLLSHAEGNLIIHGPFPETLYSKAIYSYAPIYHNLTTPAGWYPHVTSQAYHDTLVSLLSTLGKDCASTTELLSTWNITSVFAYGETCTFYSQCGFTNITTLDNQCLITLPSSRRC